MRNLNILQKNVFRSRISSSFPANAQKISRKFSTSSTDLCQTRFRNYQEEFENKYKLSQTDDLYKIFCKTDHDEIHYSLNELAYFYVRIVQMVDGTNLLQKKHVSSEIAHVVYRIKENLRDLSQEDVMIGSLAWAFWKLGYNDDQGLWLTLGDYIVDDKFHATYEESINALEGFSVLKKFADENYFENVYSKLERICFFEMKVADLKAFKRIAEAFLRVERSSADIIFSKMEELLLKNEDYKYDSCMLLDVLSAFSLSMHGSKNLFNEMQKFLLVNFESITDKAVDPSSYIATILQTYALAKYRHPMLELADSTKEFISSYLMKENLSPNLADIVKIQQNLDSFEFKDSEKIHEILDKKLFAIKKDMSPFDMVSYIDLLVNRNYKEDYKLLPRKIPDFFDTYLNKDLSSHSPQEMYYYITECDKRRMITCKKELINNMIPYILSRLRDHNADQLSYYYSLFDEYYFLIDQQNSSKELSDLRDFIQYLCHRRGFAYE